MSHTDDLIQGARDLVPDLKATSNAALLRTWEQNLRAAASQLRIATELLEEEEEHLARQALGDRVSFTIDTVDDSCGVAS